MRSDGDLNHIVEREVEYVAGTEAVASRAERSYTLLLEAGDDLVERWARLRRRMVDEPFSKVELKEEVSMLQKYW